MRASASVVNALVTANRISSRDRFGHTVLRARCNRVTCLYEQIRPERLGRDWLLRGLFERASGVSPERTAICSSRWGKPAYIPDGFGA
jgi:hypothetical protein